MITGEKKTPLTIENVLRLVTEYDIFRYYFPGDWKMNRATFSPFRSEEHPSFMIGNANGYLSFIDFGDSRYRGDCFEFVKQLYNLSSIDEVLKKIDSDFGLGISPLSQGNIGEYKKITSSYQQPDDIKKHAIIQVVTRKFTHEELAYWAEYYQDVEDLKTNHIYSIAKLYLNKKRFPLKDTELRFGYFYDGYWKIYRPFGSKKEKWVPNNVPISTLEGKENIINCGTAFINKSRKDMMVIKKVYECSCAVQNESIGCFTSENVEFLKANSDVQILSFDSDVPGVTSSQQITQLFDFGYCNVPRQYLTEGIKDWAELARKHGLKKIEEYLIEKGIKEKPKQIIL